MATVYPINKGINQPIEFKGLKAQYIWWLGGGILVLLMLFVLMYIIGVPPVLCVVLVMTGGTLLFIQVYRMSRKYGECGMMKMIARRRLPKVIKIYSRRVFTDLGAGVK